MDWTPATIVVIAIPIVVAIYFGLKSTRRKQPKFAYSTRKIIGVGADSPPELKLRFRNMPVTDVYETTLIFFNAGRESIRLSDIVKPPSYVLKMI